MIVKIISISLVSLIALFLIVINFNKRIAYKLYKIPKVHWLIKSLTFRNKEYLRASNFCMPHSVMPIIDDIGWAEGEDLRSINGPSRLITKSNPTLEDYERIVKIGKRNGIRIPAMMIISDFDHENICGQPHYNIPFRESNLTEQGVSWENHSSKDMSKDVMQLLQKNSAHVELGLHGVRHERFYENEMKNAEWADGETGRSWGDENARLHCEVFSEILGGYFSKKECCFPESFVPPSHAFAFYSNDAKILSEFGVKYMCSSCATRPSMKFLRNSGTYHDGILMLDRTELNHVNKIAYAPKDIPINAFVGAHFPNFFGKAEREWNRFFRKLEKTPNSMVGKNTRNNCSQWLYNHYTTGVFSKNKVVLNNLYMPNWAYEKDLIYGIWLKINLHSNMHLSEISIDGLKLGGYFEDGFDNGYVYLISDIKNGALEKKIYKGEYKIGKCLPKYTYVDYKNETFVLQNIIEQNNRIQVKLIAYGNHKLKIHTQNRDKIFELDIKTNNMTGEVKEFTIDCGNLVEGERECFSRSRK